MYVTYIFFGILSLFIYVGTIIQLVKKFKEAGIKGKAVFITIVSVVYIAGFAVPLLSRGADFFNDDFDDPIGMIIVLCSFFAMWLVASIAAIVGQKYASNHMPVFAPTQVMPTTGIMGGQGYSAPGVVYTPPYGQQFPQGQYYYGQGGVPQAPQGYSPQVNPAYYPAPANGYGQIPPNGYAQNPYDPNTVPMQGQPVPMDQTYTQQTPMQENEENLQ